MGLNIIMQTKEGQRHPAWDDMRYAGDKQFFDDFPRDQLEEWTPQDFPYGDDTILYRPREFTQFRLHANGSANPERWHKAAELMEADPNYWLYFSW